MPKLCMGSYMQATIERAFSFHECIHGAIVCKGARCINCACQLLVHPTDNTDLDPSSKMTMEASGEFVSLVSDEVNDQNPSQAGT